MNNNIDKESKFAATKKMIEDARIHNQIQNPWMNSTCGNCLYYIKIRINPAIIIKASPVIGECRECPPGQIPIPQQTPQGMNLNIMPMYRRIPPDFPACAKYKFRKTGTYIEDLSTIEQSEQKTENS
jgi:hypothetical protein